MTEVKINLSMNNERFLSVCSGRTNRKQYDYFLGFGDIGYNNEQGK